ncbi:MAG: ATP-binding protein [Pseudomonadota bacterium]
MKIRDYLALMAAAILIPVILFSTLSLDMLLKAERDAALKGVRETARIALVSIDRELTNTQATVRMLATSHNLATGNFGRFYERARFADREGTTWTALLDETGQQILNTALPFGSPMPPPTAGKRVQQVLASGAPQISNVIRGAVTQLQLVVVDVPVATETGKRYVIAQGFKVEHFDGVLRQLNVPASWQAGVYDRNGVTIAQLHGSTPGGKEAPPELRNVILGKAVNVVRTLGEDRQGYYTVLERSNLSGWTVAVGVPEAEIEAAARKALLVSMLGLAAAIACAAIAALFFARRLSRSIRAAARSAHALEHGQVVAPMVGSGVVEVDEVQAAISVAAKVIANEKQSRHLAEAEREQLYESEHAARTMAERQNRAKDEFLAMLGHELRNPLSAIVSASTVIGMPGMPAPSVEKAREIIGRQSRHLSRIVDDLLDVGRVHSGKILLERRAMRLDTAIETYVATLQSTGRADRHIISVQTEPAWIDADPTRLEQVISNLLDNAIKYTPAGGKIDVGVRVNGREAVVTVTDTGVGISPELMPYVFDLFVQGVRALDRAQGGLGVGLALVQRLVQLHEGRVEVRSGGPFKGSTFELHLPLIAEPGKSAPVASSQSGRQCKVLVIEDNADGREMFSMMLKSRHYEVRTAADGLEGLKMAASWQPLVALIDIGLPGMDGYEVAQRLRADPATKGMRLVALTGYGLESDRQRAIEAGFDAHLVKPVELHRLVGVLELAQA